MKAYLERRYAAGDGKSLYYREYGDPLAETIPMLCLPGPVAIAETFKNSPCGMHRTPGHLPRLSRTWALGLRSGSENYHPKKLLDDIRHLLVAANLHHFVVIGTSMGGILAIALSALIPSAVRASC